MGEGAGERVRGERKTEEGLTSDETAWKEKGKGGPGPR